MKRINADKVFSKIDFQEDVDYQTYPITTYKCPICGQQLTFNMSDFRKHSLNKTSKFSSPINEKIRHFIGDALIKESNSLIDFKCPKCGTLTRIYYTSWAGGRFTSGFKLDFVLVSCSKINLQKDG
jgi:predicted RNA-binding Zn-ribbon protein involved in translation (DUF1610 family)